MLSALIGKKIGMTQVYDANGEVQPVTVVLAGPCPILQVKTAETDGYNAVQIGFQEVKPHRTSKALIGHAVKAGVSPKKCIREYRLADGPGDAEVGQVLTVEGFEGVAMVDVTGTSKGKGTAGVMKRHHFTGQPASHGTERKHRSPGSISAHATNRGWGGDIKKGKRMAGRMGAARSTTRNHKIVAIDKENNLLLIKGAVPGANGGFVFIRASKSAGAKSK
jgi:large subunit ribosomal protein L3